MISVSSAGPTIYDVKKGQQRASNEVQVMLYMHLFPLAVRPYARTKPVSCVAYNDSPVEIPAEAIDNGFVKNFEYFLGVVGSPNRAATQGQ